MLAHLALKNIWRNRRRTLLTISAMVVSSSLLILALGVFSGMLQDMLASATEQYHGHLVISGRGYQEDRDLFNHFSPPGTLLRDLVSRQDVIGAAPRLRGFGLASSGKKSQPAELLGIDPIRETQVTIFGEHIVAGRFLEEKKTGEAVLGEGIARKLGVGPGDELVVVTQAADGSIGNDLLTVRGIFATGDTGHDNSLILVDIPWLQRLLVLPGQVHEIAVSVRDAMLAPDIARNLGPLLPDGLEVLDWTRLLPEMHEVIASFNVSRMIIIAILYLATGLGILNTFFMSVMERTREFGVLLAIGLRPWRIRLLVLMEALAMGVFSLLAGVSLGLAMTLYMDRFGIDLSGRITPITYAGGTILPRLHAVFEPFNFIIPAILLLAVSLLAAFFPANRAAGLQPVEALREE